MKLPKENGRKKSCNFCPVKNNGSLHLVITTLGQTIELRLNTAYQKVKKPFFSLTVASSNCIFIAKVLGFRVSTRDIHTDCSKQFK